ncbi:invertebrate-type lysozyme 2-like [Centruroides vittatus]|uniref:invertebrate-type lysozyme 2-like n=1 Tax=Centruroides vittatus TaxID=120091 RepID=UPI00350F2923
MLTLLFSNILFVLVAGQYPADTYIPSVSRDCLQCICKASTGCDLNMGCHNTGSGGYFCGPYLISWPFWAEGGRIGENPRKRSGFENCAKDKECSERTIHGYMNKHARDCDNDNDIDCYDIASIHKAGHYGCNATWFKNTDYWKTLEKCYEPIAH